MLGTDDKFITQKIQIEYNWFVHWTSFVFLVDLLIMLIFKLMLMLRMEKETRMTVDLPAKAIHPQ